MLLEKLCNAHGVSGDEGNVREIIRDYVSPYADEITTDVLGNLIVYKKGRNNSGKIMISAHMDEVGFIISKITEKGYLRFKTVGGIDTRVILGKKVAFKNGVKGIIGIKAIHLVTKEEEETVPKVSDLYIDIGASTEDEAKKYVSIGDYATFDTFYEEFGNNKIKAKAIDDRAGCYALAEALKEDTEYDLYACFTTQEEVGLRGSAVCAERIKPDAALVLESTTCSDVYKTELGQEVTKCGGGIAFSFMDGRTITDKVLLQNVIKVAEENNIPYQLKKSTSGGNDAGSIHLAAGGVKTISASVPCRYLHSPVGVADVGDIEALVKFAKVYIKEIGGII